MYTHPQSANHQTPQCTVHHATLGSNRMSYGSMSTKQCWIQMMLSLPARRRTLATAQNRCDFHTKISDRPNLERLHRLYSRKLINIGHLLSFENSYKTYFPMHTESILCCQIGMCFQFHSSFWLLIVPEHPIGE